MYYNLALSGLYDRSFTIITSSLARTSERAPVRVVSAPSHFVFLVTKKIYIFFIVIIQTLSQNKTEQKRITGDDETTKTTTKQQRDHPLSSSALSKLHPSLHFSPSLLPDNVTFASPSSPVSPPPLPPALFYSPIFIPRIDCVHCPATEWEQGLAEIDNEH